MSSEENQVSGLKSQYNGLEQWIIQNRKFNPYVLFVILCLIKAVMIFLQEDLLGYRADFFVDISSIGNEEASAMLSVMWSVKIFLGYASIPLYYLLKFFVVGLILWLGAFGFGYRIPFSFLFKLAMGAQVVFFIPEILKVLYFGIFSPQYGLDEFNSFQLLSFLVFIDVEESSPLLINFFEWLSLAQVLFIYLLSVGIRLKYHRTLKEAFRVVATSYIPASLFWIFFYSVVFA